MTTTQAKLADRMPRLEAADALEAAELRGRYAVTIQRYSRVRGFHNVRCVGRLSFVHRNPGSEYAMAFFRRPGARGFYVDSYRMVAIEQLEEAS